MGHGDRSMGQVHHWHGPRSPPRHCQGGPGATTSAGPQAAVTSESGLRGGRSVGGSAGRLGSCRCDRRGLFSDTGPIVALLARFWPGAPIAHVRANQPAQWSRSPLLSMLVELPLTKLGLALPPRWHATGVCRCARVARGLRIDALVDVVAHMRSAKVGLVTRTAATAAAALRTVSAGRNRCTNLSRAVLACAHTGRH
jgi:hypothetical protein